MSRCFPFPPPGYEERRHRPEDLDILKEARRKEKKHKKEKDKERKKDKEKGKDESDEKAKDKKDRKKHKDKKEKHKDKKKDKEDRSKDKEKRSISDESTVSGVKLEDKHGDKRHPEGHISTGSHIVDAGKHSALAHVQNGMGPSKSSLPSKATDESKLVQAFSRHGDKLHPEGHRKERNPVDAGKHSAILKGQNGSGPSQSVLPSKETDGSKFVQELSRRITDDGARGSKLPDRAALVDEQDKKMGAKAAAGNSSAVVGKEKGNHKDKEIDVKSLDVQGPTNVPRGFAMVPQQIPPKERGEVGRILRPLDDQNNGTPGIKEKLKETDEGKRGDKRKERDKKSHRKEKDKDKEKKRSKSKVKTERQGSEQVKLDAKGVSAGLAVVSNESTGALKEVKTSGVNEGNPRKRKDMYTNGFINETETSANKVQRHSPHQSIENGSQLKAFSTPTKSYDEHATPNSVTVDYNGRLMNGMAEAQRPFPSIPNNSPAVMVRDQVAEVPKVPNQKSILSKEMTTKVPNQQPIPSKEMTTKVPNQQPIPSKEMPTRLPNQQPIPSKETPARLPNQQPIPSKETPARLPNQQPIPSKETPAKLPNQQPIPSKETPTKLPIQKSIPMKETQTLPNLEDVIAEVTKAPDQKAILLKEMPTKAPNQKSIPSKEMQTKVPNQKSVPTQKPIPLKEATKVPTLEDLIAEASRKPPHPDSKYLSGVLTVPSVADLGDDDQDWFFSKRGPLDKPKTEPIQVDKELQVWSEAVRIEQADICALPYVIPY